MSALARRFRDELARLGAPAEGERVVVALSGGLDSTVLLHLLRFGSGGSRAPLEAAHFDHRMRPGSAADAEWVRGLCRAWDVPLALGRAEAPPQSEAEARHARYAFLDAVRREGGGWLLTAHHADDQAETVLFRALRGTGLRGLRGIPERRGSVLRPLLPFWKEELAGYAEGAGVPARTDPSNRDARFARNVLRHEVLPRVEAAVAPGARRSLVRLGRLAGDAEGGWRSLLPGLLEAVLVGTGEGRIVVARPAFSGYHRYVQARLLRELARRLGSRLDEAGTRAAVEFIRRGESGAAVDLPGGLVLAREYDTLVLGPGDVAAEQTVSIPEPGEGDGRLRLGDRPLEVRWSAREALPGEWTESFRRDELGFPLTVRGWAPGDRIRFSYGSKKLKKVFSEARVPASERRRRPVVADREGAVLWVAGVARADTAHPSGRQDALFIGISVADGR